MDECLKPCPMCKKEAQIIYRFESITNRVYCFVKCVECGYRKFKHNEYKKESKAISIWNNSSKGEI